MNRNSYLKRIQIPIIGDQNTIFFTKGKLRIATGYEKVIIRKKPNIQFLRKNICLDNLFIPLHLRWRQGDRSDWIEYRTKDYCRVRVIYCKNNERFFCSLFEIESKGSNVML